MSGLSATHADGTIDYIELLMEAGFMPVDDAEELTEGLVLHSYILDNFEGIHVIAKDHFLLAVCAEDELILTRFAPGTYSTEATMAFRVDDDCALDELTAQAFLAVAAVWMKP
jgi:hypothetical protein